ncbi:MAG: hypothetical protein IKL01_00140 [Mailhella sp.]|nr:hypothetical protein [Mailhella sp.]
MRKITYEEQLKNNVDIKERLVAEGHLGIEFDPDEADLAGAFEETALTEEDALEARFDFDTDAAE